MSADIEFRGRKPVPWTGRYTRIPGRTPVFHVRANGTGYAYWNTFEDDEWLTSDFRPHPELSRMLKAINAAKEAATRRRGGSFIINEYGQVICSIFRSHRRYWVGDLKGVPLFNDPRNPKKPFSLLPPANTPEGTFWDLPYIGLKFNVHYDDSLRFKHSDEDGYRWVHLNGRADQVLIDKLRRLRPQAGVIRFIVNLHGVVLTKVEPDWKPVYVGRLNFNRWFEKESP